jgi:hypothetical protein
MDRNRATAWEELHCTLPQEQDCPASREESLLEDLQDVFED